MRTDTREVCARCLCLCLCVCEVPVPVPVCVRGALEVWRGVAGVWQGCGEAVTTALLPAAYLGKA